MRSNGRNFGAALIFALFVLLGVMPARALVIVPVWDSSIANDPNAATIEGTITSAIQFYEARFADPITVTIQFEESSGGPPGQSQWYYYQKPYSTILSALQRDATTANDTNALANLPAGPNNPVTGDTLINVHNANLEAIGFTDASSGLPGGVDGVILLNPSVLNLSRASINPSKTDLLAAAEHEMDEVLGFGSGLPDSAEPFPQDLFRYSAEGDRAFTTNGDDAYFSLDGVNLLVQFNQRPGFDYGDWWFSGAHTPRVQDAAATPGSTPNPNVELIGLDVIGYDLLPLPQPGIQSITLSSTNVVLNATNGIATGIYVLLDSTNLTLPLNQWSPLATNALLTNGNFTMTVTNSIPAESAGEFYMLQLQL
jgi:hypothetical protein